MSPRSLALLFTVLAMAPFVFGCAFSAVNRPNPRLYYNFYPHEQAHPLSPAAALDASRSALEAMGYEIQSVTPEIGQLRTKVLGAPIPETCDCGTWNLGPVRGVADTVFVLRVAPHSESQSTIAVELLCTANFSGQNLYGATTRVESYQCASRGIIEKNFWSTLAQILQARAEAPPS